MNILFHSNQLDERGTSTALFDYAYYNETILGNVSYIAAPIKNCTPDLTERFHKAFPDGVYLYRTLEDLQDFCYWHHIDVVYWVKYGTEDGSKIEGVRNVVHAVFHGGIPHGDKYAAVSKWLGDKYNIPYVPHIVSLPNITEDYREQLGIPSDALVYGRYGGTDSFDDPAAYHAVEKVARQNPGIYFLFMNTNPFCAELPNIIHIAATTDVEEKTAFINTCDAMLHSRLRGETFGLSVCEFLHQNKPVITRIDSPERNHIRVLEERGYYYSSGPELEAILTTFKRSDYDYRNLIQEFSPGIVMSIFEQTFLK